MRTILKHVGTPTKHAGKALKGYDIERDWLAIHFTDGSSLLFRSDACDDDARICREDAAPEELVDQLCLGLISDDEYRKKLADRAYEKAKAETAARRAEYEKLKAEFEGEGK